VTVFRNAWCLNTGAAVCVITVLFEHEHLLISCRDKPVGGYDILKERDHLEDLGEDGRIILKRILKK
jgi:hypothetical protein